MALRRVIRRLYAPTLQKPTTASSAAQAQPKAFTPSPAAPALSCQVGTVPLGAQRAGGAVAAAMAPGVQRTALAQIAGVVCSTISCTSACPPSCSDRRQVAALSMNISGVSTVIGPSSPSDSATCRAEGVVAAVGVAGVVGLACRPPARWRCAGRPAWRQRSGTAGCARAQRCWAGRWPAARWRVHWSARCR